jgi:hypothetical protein
MPAKSVYEADVDGQIVPGLPLNIQRAVHCIGQFIGAIIDAQIEGYGVGSRRRAGNSKIAVLIESASVRED